MRSQKYISGGGVLSILILALAGFMSACTKDVCIVNSQCGQGKTCRLGRCLQVCRSVYTCNYEEGEACVNGACEVPPGDYCAFFLPTAEQDGRQPPMCIDQEVSGDQGGGDDRSVTPNPPTPPAVGDPSPDRELRRLDQGAEGPDAGGTTDQGAEDQGNSGDLGGDAGQSADGSGT